MVRGRWTTRAPNATKRPMDSKLRQMKPGCLVEANRLAEIHENAPSQWLGGYVPSAEIIGLRTEEFRKVSQQLDRTLLLIAESNGEISGFHWVDKEGHAAQIKSLWVAESHRKSGLAATLKSAGEAWAKSRHLKEMVTSVHFTNKRMLDINLRNGFVPGFVQMTKPLS